MVNRRSIQNASISQTSDEFFPVEVWDVQALAKQDMAAFAVLNSVRFGG